MVTIRDDQIRRVEADPGRVTIVDAPTGNRLTASLSPDERRTLAAALVAALVPATESTPVADWLTAQYDAPHVHWAMNPGGQWTRADLPRRSLLRHRFLCAGGGTDERMDAVLDQVAEWLNVHHPKPVPYDQGGWPEGWQSVANMEARAITAEHARDAAVERVARRDEEIDLIARQCAEARAARDAAIARAEQAESERDGWRENAEHRSTIIEQLRDRISDRDYRRSLADTTALKSAQGFLDWIARDDLGVYAVDPVDRAEGDGKADCPCAHCHSRPYSIMHICPDCGSKRCPRAAHHVNPCEADR